MDPSQSAPGTTSSTGSGQQMNGQAAVNPNYLSHRMMLPSTSQPQPAPQPPAVLMHQLQQQWQLVQLFPHYIALSTPRASSSASPPTTDTNLQYFRALHQQNCDVLNEKAFLISELTRQNGQIESQKMDIAELMRLRDLAEAEKATAIEAQRKAATANEKAAATLAAIHLEERMDLEEAREHERLAAEEELTSLRSSLSESQRLQKESETIYSAKEAELTEMRCHFKRFANDYKKVAAERDHAIAQSKKNSTESVKAVHDMDQERTTRQKDLEVLQANVQMQLEATLKAEKLAEKEKKEKEAIHQDKGVAERERDEARGQVHSLTSHVGDLKMKEDALNTMLKEIRQELENERAARKKEVDDKDAELERLKIVERTRIGEEVMRVHALLAVKRNQRTVEKTNLMRELQQRLKRKDAARTVVDEHVEEVQPYDEMAPPAGASVIIRSNDGCLLEKPSCSAYGTHLDGSFKTEMASVETTVMAPSAGPSIAPPSNEDQEDTSESGSRLPRGRKRAADACDEMAPSGSSTVVPPPEVREESEPCCSTSQPRPKRTVKIDDIQTFDTTTSGTPGSHLKRHKREERAPLTAAEKEQEKYSKWEDGFLDGKAKYWNDCYRCKLPLQMKERKPHYRQFHFDKFYSHFMDKKKNEVERWALMNLGGGPSETRISSDRGCLKCADRKLYSGRLVLLRHIEKAHPPHFRLLQQEYEEMNEQIQDSDLHCVLTGAE